VTAKAYEAGEEIDGDDDQGGCHRVLDLDQLIRRRRREEPPERSSEQRLQNRREVRGVAVNRQVPVGDRATEACVDPFVGPVARDVMTQREQTSDERGREGKTSEDNGRRKRE